MRFMSLPDDLIPACMLALTLLAHADGQQSRSEEGVTCPVGITTTESTQVPQGWNVTTPTSQHPFERISVYNGSAGGQEFELAPDDEAKRGNRVIQTWHLKGYRTMNIFLRCRYHDSSVVLMKDLPPQIQTCTLRFAIQQGKIVGESAMDCR
jgi:hypothetical protein